MSLLSSRPLRLILAAGLADHAHGAFDDFWGILGLLLHDSILSNNGASSKPGAVQMPWGFAINSGHALEYAMVRFARRGVSDLSTVLKPFVPGLNVPGPKKLTLNYVLSDTVDDVPSAKKIESTKSYGAAVRFLAGDNSPTAGHPLCSLRLFNNLSFIAELNG